MTEQNKAKSALDELFDGIQIITASEPKELSATKTTVSVQVSIPTEAERRTPAYQYRPGFQAPRKSQFPGKETGSFSFNLTAFGRQLLKSGSTSQNISQGDYIEKLLRLQAFRGVIVLATKKTTGEKGGAKSFYFGKNRGTTTAVCITPTARRIADELVKSARETCADGINTKPTRISRGDMIEFLLRQQAEVS